MVLFLCADQAGSWYTTSMPKENFDYFKGTSKEVPKYIEKETPESEAKLFPIIDEAIQTAIKKYNLVRRSNANQNAILFDSAPDENVESLKKQAIFLNNKRNRKNEGAIGSISFYSKDGKIRLSDHWYPDALYQYRPNFSVEDNFAYVATKNDTGSWDLLEKIPLYQTQPVYPATKDRHLKSHLAKKGEEVKKDTARDKDADPSSYW